MTTLEHKESADTSHRVTRFLHKPWREKQKSIRNRCARILSSVPVPIRLPFGALWLARHDNLGEPLRAGTFERLELAFVERFLQPGMTVLDIGAHHGLYTLLASGRVGPAGRVFSFEPSPRERRALRLHIALNFRWNVSVQKFALGSEETTADLFVVQGRETGCNTLRPPDVFGPTFPLRVEVTTLDLWLQRKNINKVDFIKLDVEGAELDVLRGAARLFSRTPRPIILAEVQDVRTAPWRYKAKEILAHLDRAHYAWFCPVADGSLQELDMRADTFTGNFVAIPRELIQMLRPLVQR